MSTLARFPCSNEGFPVQIDQKDLDEVLMMRGLTYLDCWREHRVKRDLHIMTTPVLISKLLHNLLGELSNYCPFSFWLCDDIKLTLFLSLWS